MLRSERSERLEARGPSVAAHPSRQALRAFLRVRRSRQAKSRLARSEPLAVAAFTMSNSAVLFVPAHALLRPGLCVSSVPSLSPPPVPQGLWRRRPSRQQQFRPPDEGWMERRQAHFFVSVAPATRDHPVPGRPEPLSALHRGGFRMRTHEAGSRQWDRSRQRLPAPGHKAWRSGSGPPCGAVRAASAGRHSWLRLAGSFLENAPSEPGCKIIYYIFVT
jgi:hypothetical protein